MNMAKKDYYETLGVQKNASKEDIKKAYKNLAKKYHPDITKDKSTEEKFKEISEAYAVLSDDQKRAQYDQFGHEAFDQRFSQEDIFRNFDFDIFREFGNGFDSIFDIFFGRGNRRAKQRGADLRYDLPISFEEAAFGVKKEIQFQSHARCTSCNGSGAEENSFETCKSCQGQGQIRRSLRTPFGVMNQITTCHACQGEGKVIKKRCKLCRGSGRIEKTKTVEITIPAGVDNGNQIRLDGEGELGDHNLPGDLYVVIHVRPHKHFHREDADLHLDFPISFAAATLGGIVEVPTLESKVELKIPSGTQSHTTFRLKNQGIKQLRGSGKGDLYVRVIINIPKHLSRKQRKILEEFEKE